MLSQFKREDILMSHLKPILVLVMFFGASHAAAAYSDIDTLYVSAASAGACGGLPVLYVGYNSYLSNGSYSPTALTGGELVSALDDVVDPMCSLHSSGITVSGFSSNPGAGWLSSVRCGGVTNTGSSASFNYSSGTADWSWG